MPKRPKNEAFDVPMDEGERRLLAHELCREIDDALSARAAVIEDGGIIDLIDWFYEQGRSAPQDRPFPGAADLTSPFITESVDSLRARLTGTLLKTEPFCIVDGWGDSAKNAPAVEAFHDWQVSETGLPEELSKVVHGALIEDAYILEVRERIETRKISETIDVALELNEQGGPILENGKPKLKMDAAGEPVIAQAHEPAATVTRTHTKTKRLGPEYDAISMKDFVFLPGHAKNQRQVWGYAYRLWKRVPELDEAVKDGIYDETAVEAIGRQSDRDSSAIPSTVEATGTQLGASAEKELWHITLKRDVDGDGREEWYAGTLSLQYRELLRLKLDTFVQKMGRPRCVPFVLFPRRDSVYGYSFGGDKLLTLAEEHTALRNMIADRSALATNSPISVTSTSMWDPDAEPIGVGRIIHVRDHNEIKQLTFQDVPPSAVERERSLFTLKERVSGLADSSNSVLSAERRTLGENQLVSAGSQTRVEEPLSHLRTAIAAVMQICHAIWLDVLKADPKGLEAPSAVVEALSNRGVEMQNGRFTLAMMEGTFRFKPYGSVDTADLGQAAQNLNNGILALANMSKVMPMIAVVFQDPDVVKTVLQEWARVHKMRNSQVFLKALMAPPQMPMPGASPGAVGGVAAPPGLPPVPDLASLMASLGGGAHVN